MWSGIQSPSGLLISISWSLLITSLIASSYCWTFNSSCKLSLWPTNTVLLTLSTGPYRSASFSLSSTSSWYLPCISISASNKVNYLELGCSLAFCCFSSLVCAILNLSCHILYFNFSSLHIIAVFVSGSGFDKSYGGISFFLLPIKVPIRPKLAVLTDSCCDSSRTF